MKRFIIPLLIVALVQTSFGQSTSNQNNDSKLQNEFDDFKKYRDPTVAGLFSWFLPGAGQFYNRQPGKGVVFLGAYIASFVLMANHAESATLDDPISPAGFGLMLVTSVVSIVDASSSARKINRDYGLSLKMNINPNQKFGVGLVKNF